MTGVQRLVGKVIHLIDTAGQPRAGGRIMCVIEPDLLLVEAYDGGEILVRVDDLVTPVGGRPRCRLYADGEEPIPF